MDCGEWRFPGEIPGWLSEAEGRALAELARGKRVLEIGSYKGRSTVCMAQTAEYVVAVDHGRGDEESGFEPSTEALRANLSRCGVAGRVALYPQPIEEVAPWTEDAQFDLVFVDGAHDEPSVRRDLEVARRVVRPGGTIALHDCDYPTVQAAGRAILGWHVGLNGESGGRTVDRLYARAWLPDAPADPEIPMPREGDQFVYLGLPRRPGARGPDDEADDEVSLVNPVKRGFFKVSRSNISLLNLAFNKHWAMAMNAMRALPISHFAMQHDDVVPPAGWCDTLIDEQAACDVDVVSAVIPIKDERGLVTTGVRNAVSGHVRRLTMAEVFRLPETFGWVDLRAAGITTGTGPIAAEFLVVNTGLWVARLDRPWVRDFDGFRSVDRIHYLPDGTCEAGCLSEDWCWSEWLWRHGARVLATRKVPLAHLDGEGREYRNDHVWGTCTVDPGDYPKRANAAAPEPQRLTR